MGTFSEDMLSPPQADRVPVLLQNQLVMTSPNLHSVDVSRFKSENIKNNNNTHQDRESWSGSTVGGLQRAAFHFLFPLQLLQKTG